VTTTGAGPGRASRGATHEHAATDASEAGSRTANRAPAGASYAKAFKVLAREADRAGVDVSPLAEPEAVAAAVDVALADEALGMLLVKLERKPSRSSVAPKPTKRESVRALELTGPNLYAEAAKVPASGRWHSNVFLAPLLERFGTTPQAARARLLELHRSDEIELRRAELVDSMNPDLVRRSAIDVGTYTFHFLGPKP